MTRSIPLLMAAVLVVPTAARAAPDASAASQTSEDPSADPSASMPPVSGAATRRFALVIGSNDALEPTLAPLRFADDDAARMAEVLEEAGVDVELVTQLDRDSQALFPDLVGRSRRPTRAGVDTAWAALQVRMLAAKDAGASTELIVYYSGHGDVGPDGQGYLTLDGGKLKRRDLFRRVLGTSTADHNHVLIDACKSEQFVLARGSGGPWKSDRSARDYGQAVGEYLDKNHLGHFPNTGVVLAHSADQQTHEWERYRGGIFTHQLVSGLRGGADLNGDGNIEYSELGAFVSAANHGVSDPRARLSVVTRPPKANERQPLLSYADVASQRTLFFDRGDNHRYTVEDARGVRVADVRHSGEQPGYLRLPPGDMFVRRMTPGTPEDRQQAPLPASNRGVVLASALPFVAATSSARGSLDQAFRAGLFSTPYGPGYYSGFTDRTGILAVAEPQWHAEIWNGVAPLPGPDVVADGENPETDAPGEEGDDDTPSFGRTVDKALDKAADRTHNVTWGGVFVGTVLSPFSAREAIPLSPKRVRANETRSCLDPYGGDSCSALRGFDVRWQVMRVRTSARFPRMLGYFRSGYQGAYATFSPRSGEPQPSDPTDISTVIVPLHFGGQAYVFDDFPLRPYAGLGVGLDIVRVRYSRPTQPDRVRGGALLGFAVHAGLELRLTNYVALSAEVRQQWSTRKRVDDIPDFSNTGLTFVTGVSIGFPLHPKRARGNAPQRKGH